MGCIYKSGHVEKFQTNCRFPQDAPWSALDYLLPSDSLSVYFVLAVLRYLKSDGRLNSVIFSNIQLADGKPHAVILWLSGLQQGLSTVELYLDCLQVGAIEDLPKPFSALSQKVVAAELRTLQEKPQVSMETGNRLRT